MTSGLLGPGAGGDRDGGWGEPVGADEPHELLELHEPHEPPEPHWAPDELDPLFDAVPLAEPALPASGLPGPTLEAPERPGGDGSGLLDDHHGERFPGASRRVAERRLPLRPEPVRFSLAPPERIDEHLGARQRVRAFGLLLVSLAALAALGAAVLTALVAALAALLGQPGS